MALGDSYTFGEGVNYGSRYSEIIENALNNTEVINMGVWGFGLDQSFLQLQRDGINFNPDLVIVFLNQVYLVRCRSPFWLDAQKPRFILSEDKQSLLLQKINPEKHLPPRLNNAVKQENSNGLLEKSKLFAYFKKRMILADEKNKLREKEENFGIKFISLRQSK